jgi:alpha-tubulin suppressor-like RCC1 family protein
VSAGGHSTCGITTDDGACCWGRNAEGQLGDGRATSSLTPVAAVGRRRFRQVRAGNNHTCVITPFDVGFCWGYNASGQLGDGSSTKRMTPAQLAGGTARASQTGAPGRPAA